MQNQKGASASVHRGSLHIRLTKGKAKSLLAALIYTSSRAQGREDGEIENSKSVLLTNGITGYIKVHNAIYTSRYL